MALRCPMVAVTWPSTPRSLYATKPSPIGRVCSRRPDDGSDAQQGRYKVVCSLEVVFDIGLPHALANLLSKHSKQSSSRSAVNACSFVQRFAARGHACPASRSNCATSTYNSIVAACGSGLSPAMTAPSSLLNIKSGVIGQLIVSEAERL